MKHATPITSACPRPASDVMAPDYPAGPIGWLLAYRDAKKGIVY